jgi:hypothetical protein
MVPQRRHPLSWRDLYQRCLARPTGLSSPVHHLSTEMSISGVHLGREVMREGAK